MEILFITIFAIIVSIKLYLKNLKFKKTFRKKTGYLKNQIMEVKNKKIVSENKNSSTIDCKNVFEISKKVLKLQQKIINSK